MPEIETDGEARRQVEALEDGSLDPDELTGERDWGDDASDDED